MEASSKQPAFIVVGVNHHTASLPALEALAKHFALPSPEPFKSLFSLSTCNRIEIYAALEPFWCETTVTHEAASLLSDHFTHLGVEAEQTYVKAGQEAIQHLFLVCASLDSMVVGEPQILGQVKEAYQCLLDSGSSCADMDQVLRKSISVAKRIRTETDIAKNPISIAHVANYLAEKIFGDLSAANTLLLGSGKMGRLSAKHLKRRGVRNIILCNRSYDKALRLAKEISAVASPIELLDDYLSKVDILIVSTSQKNHVLSKERIMQAMDRRKHKDLFLIDLSMPRNIDPGAGDLKNVYLYNIEDLKDVAATHLQGREREVGLAQEIVEMEVDRFLQKLFQRRHHRVIAEMKHDMAMILQRELQGKWTSTDGDALKTFADHLADKLVQGPAHYLKRQEP